MYFLVKNRWVIAVKQNLTHRGDNLEPSHSTYRHKFK